MQVVWSISLISQSQTCPKSDMQKYSSFVQYPEVISLADNWNNAIGCNRTELELGFAGRYNRIYLNSTNRVQNTINQGNLSVLSGSGDDSGAHWEAASKLSCNQEKLWEVASTTIVLILLSCLSSVKGILISSCVRWHFSERWREWEQSNTPSICYCHDDVIMTPC